MSRRSRGPAAALILAAASASAAVLPLASGAAAKSATSTTLIVTPTTPQQGQPLRFSVTISPSGSTAAVTGIVTIRVSSQLLCTVTLIPTSRNRGTCSSRQTPAGSHTIRASYLGSPKFRSSSASSFVYVLKTSS